MKPEANRNKRMASLETVAEKVARSLAMSPDLNVVVSGGEVPRYDGSRHTLYMPAFSATELGGDPDLADAWRGILDHEVAHVIHSDMTEYEARVRLWHARHGSDTGSKIATLANAGEDLWIEPTYAIRHPGSRYHFEATGRWLYRRTGGVAAATDPEFSANGGGPQGVFGALVQSLLRLGRGQMKREDVHETPRQLLEAVWPQVRVLFDASSTKEACDAAENLFNAIKLAAEPPPPPPPPEEPEESESDEEAGEDEGEGSEGDGEEPGGPSTGSGEEEGEEGSDATSDASSAPDGSLTTPHEGVDGEDGEPGAGTAFVYDEDGTREIAAEAAGGEWGEVDTAADVIANHIRSTGKAPKRYIASPAALACDTVKKYDESERAAGRAMVPGLVEAAGQSVQQLMSMLRGAVQASRQCIAVGGLEEGPDIDDAAISAIATRTNGPDIFSDLFRAVDESTYVCILVDCSGSMGCSAPRKRPVTDGKGEPVKDAEGRTVHRKVMCSKAGYAAVTAMALHKAMSGCRIPHAVLGYTTNTSRPSYGHGAEYARYSCGMEMHEFVPSPGISDDGAAIPFVTGRLNNLDGESVMWAAKYAAKHGGSYDRVIMLVVADGLPAGADDWHLEGAHLEQVVQQVAGAGIEVYGIGVCIHDMATFRKYYPDSKGGRGVAPTGSVEIKAGEGLTYGVLRKLTELLTRGYGMSRKVR